MHLWIEFPYDKRLMYKEVYVLLIETDKNTIGETYAA
jgi:hypothetical protein